jgi:hypothetical protein
VLTISITSLIISNFGIQRSNRTVRLILNLNIIQSIMKNTILILAACLALLSCKKDDKTVIEQTTVEETAPADNGILVTQCYRAVTSIQDEGKTINDSILLNFQRTGDSITGEFKWLPYYKDKKTGTFKGTVQGRTATTVLTATGEGMTNKEEFIFDIDAKEVNVKMGEMAEGKDGVWHYKDKNAASGNAIPRTDCK